MPHAQPQRAATTPTALAPATPVAPPTQPERLDPFEIMRKAKPRKATPAQIDALSRTWSRR